MTTKSILRKKYWLWVLGWIALIYSTLSIVRPICEYLKKHTPFAVFMNVLMACLLAALVILLVFKIRIHRGASLVWLFFVLSGYSYGLWMIKYPEEKLHFVEYGLLAFLIHRACCLDLRKELSYIVAFILTSLAGWGDEMLQGVLPNRYYQTDDVLLNIFSGLLGLGLVFIFERERLSKCVKRF